jgi:hypothetical protein
MRVIERSKFSMVSGGGVGTIGGKSTGTVAPSGITQTSNGTYSAFWTLDNGGSIVCKTNNYSVAANLGLNLVTGKIGSATGGGGVNVETTNCTITTVSPDGTQTINDGHTITIVPPNGGKPTVIQIGENEVDEAGTVAQVEAENGGSVDTGGTPTDGAPSEGGGSGGDSGGGDAGGGGGGGGGAGGGDGGGGDGGGDDSGGGDRDKVHE